MFERIGVFFASVLLFFGINAGSPAKNPETVNPIDGIVDEVTLATPSAVYNPSPTLEPNLPAKSFPRATIKDTGKIDPTPRNIEDEKIQFISPVLNKAYNADATVAIEVKIIGEVDKVEIYVASGILAGTLFSQPFTLDVSLPKYVSVDKNYRLPLEVKAYRKDGAVFRKGMVINVVPKGSDTSFDIPESRKDISYKNINFVKDPNSENSRAQANGYFMVEEYDEFNNTTSVRTKGKAYNLKPNSQYDVFVITKRESMSIGSLPTDINGYGEFSTGLFTDQHYCDIYTLGIKLSGKPDNETDLWANELVDICQKG